MAAAAKKTVKVGATGATNTYDLDAVKKNAKGGVFVSEEVRFVILLD